MANENPWLVLYRELYYEEVRGRYKLHEFILALADRVHRQSELLSKRAEKVTQPRTDPTPSFAQEQERMCLENEMAGLSNPANFVMIADWRKREMEMVGTEGASPPKSGEARTEPTRSLFDWVVDELRQLHLGKSSDYGSDADPLANYTTAAEFAGIETWRGIWCRLMEKAQRIKTLCSGKELKNEQARESFRDLALISVLLYGAWLRDHDHKAGPSVGIPLVPGALRRPPGTAQCITLNPIGGRHGWLCCQREIGHPGPHRDLDGAEW